MGQRAILELTLKQMRAEAAGMAKHATDAYERGDLSFAAYQQALRNSLDCQQSLDSAHARLEAMRRSVGAPI